MKILWIATAAFVLAVPALAAEATFERNLSVNGKVELSLATGAGNIHLTRGSDNQVHIFGRVKTCWGLNCASDARVREIASNPPIEQTGNIIRIGAHSDNLNNISIDYEIQAPAGAYLDVATGSGNVNDDNVGEHAKLSTGSGNIHAVGLHGGFSANTGSGNIYAEQTGEGDVKAQTGSGNLELRNLRGGLRAGAGSGDIKVSGTPTANWHIESGSGDVEYWAGSAALTLDAFTGSGDIHIDHEYQAQGSSDKHHITGRLNGGGSTVHIKTGSGSIHVH